MCVRSVLSLLALILAGALLFIVGAVVVLAYRDRRPGFSYFAYGMPTPRIRISEDYVAVALARARESAYSPNCLVDYITTKRDRARRDIAPRARAAPTEK